MKLTHREEEGGVGPHKCQTSLDTKWILSACDSCAVVSIFLIYSPLVEFYGSNSTMDSNITEIIEEFMDSALAQWVCHSSFVTFREKNLSFHLMASLEGFIRTGKTDRTNC